MCHHYWWHISAADLLFSLKILPCFSAGLEVSSAHKWLVGAINNYVDIVNCLASRR